MEAGASARSGAGAAGAAVPGHKGDAKGHQGEGEGGETKGMTDHGMPPGWVGGASVHTMRYA